MLLIMYVIVADSIARCCGRYIKISSRYTSCC